MGDQKMEEGAILAAAKAADFAISGSKSGVSKQEYISAMMAVIVADGVFDRTSEIPMDIVIRSMAEKEGEKCEDSDGDEYEYSDNDGYSDSESAYSEESP